MTKHEKLVRLINNDFQSDRVEWNGVIRLLTSFYEKLIKFLGCDRSNVFWCECRNSWNPAPFPMILDWKGQQWTVGLLIKVAELDIVYVLDGHYVAGAQAIKVADKLFIIKKEDKDFSQCCEHIFNDIKTGTFRRRRHRYPSSESI